MGLSHAPLQNIKKSFDTNSCNNLLAFEAVAMHVTLSLRYFLLLTYKARMLYTAVKTQCEIIQFVQVLKTIL